MRAHISPCVWMGNMVTSNSSLAILMDSLTGGNFAVMASLDVMMLVVMTVFFCDDEGDCEVY